MNKYKFAALLIMIFVSMKSYSNTHTISVGGMVFNPTPADVTVGDTVKWVWVDGFHTTTSTSVPSGALPWDALIDNTHTSYSYVITAAGQYNYRCSFHYVFGMTGIINANPIGIENISGNIPEKFALHQNYPNPFNPTANIIFDVSVKALVKLTVYDLKGSEVTTLVHEELSAGSYSVNWNAAGNPSGTYFVRMVVLTDKPETSGQAQTIKVVLVK